MNLVSVLAIALLGLVASVSGKPDKLVCFFGSWATYRVGDGKYEVENIDPFLCTHAVYAFIGLEPSLTGEIQVLDPWNDLPNGGGKDGFRRFNELKRINPNLKTLISIGGISQGTDKFSKVFADEAKRAVFVKSASSFLGKHGFDGLDIDWQVPRSSDRFNFVSVLSELKTEFSMYGYLLTAVIPGHTFDLYYYIPGISEYLDFINVMTYDYISMHSFNVDVHSPLNIVKERIEELMENGAPSEKIIMGIGMFGRSFTIENSTCLEPRCPASGPGIPGNLKEANLLGYNEICLIEKSGTKAWYEDAQVPYMSWGDQWVGYDDPKSAKLKVDLIKEYNLGGGMIWSVETDDFLGKCGNGKNPMITTISKELFGEV